MKSEILGRCDDQRVHVDGEVLSPIERLILTHDGTVMRMLEALTGQSVAVTIISRSVCEETLYRNVTLNVPDDCEPLAWAESEVDLTSLDTECARALRDGDVGIGKLLQARRFETFRELVDVDLVTAKETASLPSFVEADAGTLFERTYKVYHDDTDVMTITEYFPKGEFERFLA